MSSRYAEAELDNARLRLIDSIPEEGHGICRPLRGDFWQSPYECEASRVPGLREIAEELALRASLAAGLIDENEGMQSYEITPKGPVRFTKDERLVGECMLRRALGICPLIGEKDV